MCADGIFRTILDHLLSLFACNSSNSNSNGSTSLIEAEGLTKKEKKLLIENWPGLKKKNPDLFLKAWIKSARMSVNIKKATGLRDDEDPTTNERFISLSPYVESFVDKLIIEYQCNDTKVADACRKLGARHVLIENFHTNFWDIFLGNLIHIIIETHSEQELRKIVAICEKFFAYFVSFMRDGYKKRIQENLTGQRRSNT